MKFSPALKVFLAVSFIVFGIIIVFGVYHYRVNTRAGKSGLMLQHTDEVLYTSERVLSGLKDIETGTRGYVITGDSDFLQPYMLSKDSVIKNMNELKALIGENAVQEPRVKTLAELTQKRLDIARKVQAKRALAAYKPEDILPLIFNGKKVMDEIRDSVGKIQAEEKRQLDIRKKQYQQDQNEATRSFVMLIASMVVLVITLFLAARFFAMLRKNDAASSFRQNAQNLFFRNRFDDIVKSIADPLVAIDKNYTISFYNNAAQTSIAHGKGLLTGENIYEAFPHYKDSILSVQIKTVLETREPAEFEMHEDFLEKWFDVSVYPIGDGGISIYMKDATQRKNYEKQLHSAVQFLEETNRVANVGGWELDVASGKVSWTHMTHVIHEMPPGYIPDLKNAILFYKEGKSREIITQLVTNAIENKVEWDTILQIITAAGNEKWVRSVGKPKIKDGEVHTLVGTFQDVDEQKKISDQLRESEQRFRSAFSNSLDGMTLVAADGTIIETNKAFTEILGYSKEELQQLGFKKITHPDDHAHDDALQAKILSGETSNWRFQKRYIHKNGSIVRAEASGSVITDAEGNISGFVAQMQKL